MNGGGRDESNCPDERSGGRSGSRQGANISISARMANGDDGPQAAQAAGTDAEAAAGASVREAAVGRGQNSYNSSKRRRVAETVTAER